MAALIAMPAVAFAVLVTIIYEDRLLPRTGSAQPPAADAEPAAASAPTAAVEPVAEAAAASRPAAQPADPASGTRPRTRHCHVRQGAAPQGRLRTRRPAVGAVPERRTPVPPRPSRSPELRHEGAVSVPPR